MNYDQRENNVLARIFLKSFKITYFGQIINWKITQQIDIQNDTFDFSIESADF